MPREKLHPEDAKLYAFRVRHEPPIHHPLAPVPTFAARHAAIEETAGALSGVYEPAELRTLRDDWPT